MGNGCRSGGRKPTAFKLTGKMMQRGGVQKLREKSSLLLVEGRTVYTSLSAREVRDLVCRTKVFPVLHSITYTPVCLMLSRDLNMEDGEERVDELL